MAKDTEKKKGSEKTEEKGTEMSDKQKKREEERLALIEKMKKNIEITSTTGSGPKVTVEDVGEVHLRSCGNCLHFKKPDENRITCADLGIEKNLSPCSMKKTGNGYFTPVQLTGTLVSLKKEISKLEAAEISFVPAMLDHQRENLLSVGITGFSIGQKVKWTHNGKELTGEIDGLTRTHVHVVADDGSTAKLLPGSVSKV